MYVLTASVHVVLLYSKGGNGKSTLLQALTGLLKGCCCPADMSSLGCKKRTMPKKELLIILCSSRVAVCEDVDLSEGYINENFLKVVTGGFCSILAYMYTKI